MSPMSPKSAARRTAAIAVLLGVLVAGFVAYGALATAPPAAPSITVKPSNPSTTAAASFTFTHSQSVTFQCSLDGSAFTNCAGPGTSGSKSYTVGQGSHTFRVLARTATQTSSTASYTWLVDSLAPTVSSINRASSSPTNAASVQWSVAFSEPVKGVDASDFAVQKVGLGGSPAITAVSPSVSSSASVFTVTASTGSGSGTLGLNLTDNDSIVDGAGNKLGGSGVGNGSFTAGQLYTIDRGAPAAPAITSGPAASPAWTTTTGVGFQFTGEAGASFACKLDGGSFVGCSSPKNYSGLGQGAHSFQVQQTDQAGNTGPAASRTFQIDSIAPPTPSIGSKPSNPTNATSANLVFSDSEPGVTFTCRLDGGSFAACTSPKSYPSLSEATHTFQVKARDAVGNESAAASWSWRVDTTAPHVPELQFAPFTWPPLGWSSTSAVFAFDDESSDVVSYLCKLDAGAFAGCTSWKSYSGLAQGQHTFQVKAVDGAGNVSGPRSRTFFVDTVEPTKAHFTQAPSDPSPTATSTFAWTSTDPAPGSGLAGYLCSKENGPYFGCSSPYTYAVQTTNNGKHQFSVVAVDWAGNVSDEAKHKWTVGAGSPQQFTITGTVTGLTIGVPKPVTVTLGNPNNVPIYVTLLTTTLSTDGGSGGCSASNFTMTQSNASAGTPITVPASSSVVVSAAPQAPQVALVDLASNQDVCKGKSFVLTFSGSAHS